MSEVYDLIAAIVVFVGTIFCLSAAVGIVRFPDVITRLHAATKPQVFGLLVILTGVVVSQRSWQVLGVCLLVVMFQIITNPVSAHMVSRTAYRTGLWDSRDAVLDELGDDLVAAGYIHPEDSHPGDAARRDPRT